MQGISLPSRSAAGPIGRWSVAQDEQPTSGRSDAVDSKRDRELRSRVESANSHPHGGALRPAGRLSMSRATRATKMLEAAGVAVTVHSYDYDPGADRIGLQAAEALGESPDRVLKTLMALVDGKSACVIAPSNREVSMKKLAAAFGGKSAEMMKPAEAERASGYKVGGISPFGQMKPTRTAIEEQALAHEQVFLNGGQRGLQVRLSPRDAAAILNAVVASLAA